MRYLVKARIKTGQAEALLAAIDSRELGRGSIAGDEYLHNMAEARIDESGVTQWVESCFCATPLEEERPYWEKYFDLHSIKDAHARRNCRHENGSEPWACCDCDCTAKLEERLKKCGKSLLNELQQIRAWKSQLHHALAPSHQSTLRPIDS
jgi:hypothetical protein